MVDKLKGNTIDLRGNEQTATYAQAEQFAAYMGYEMFYYGYSADPHDVDPDAAHDYDDDNPWYPHTHTYCDVCAVWYPNDDKCGLH